MSSMTMTSVTMSMRSCCWSSTEVSAPSSWVWSVQPWPGLSSSTTLSTVTSWSSNLHKSNIHFYLDVPGVDLSWWGAVSGLGRRRNTLHINTLHLHLLLVLHPPVLEPDLDLSLCQVQHRRHLNASREVRSDKTKYSNNVERGNVWAAPSVCNNKINVTLLSSFIRLIVPRWGLLTSIDPMEFRYGTSCFFIAKN